MSVNTKAGRVQDTGETKILAGQSGAGDQLTNGGAGEMVQPYRVELTIEGTSDLLFHRWSNEAVAAKGAAAKGSKAKKTDNVESYVWRNESNELCVPGEYLRQAIVGAAKFAQDPRSPRKSAQDLVKAGLLSLTPLASLGRSKWDYDHAARVSIQRNSITRIRPAFRQGWKATLVFLVNLPEYISRDFLRDLVTNAGRLIGVGDFRPSYGRFAISNFAVLAD
jgi:hypothetical protein